jgi:hypothetical protein
MQLKPFQYTVLTFRPAPLQDERVTIGLFFLFPEDSRIEFLAPLHLQRLKSLYPDTNINLLRSYLHSFRSQVRKIEQRNLFTEGSPERLLEKEFRLPDADGFFVSEWKSGFYLTVESLLEKFQREHFSFCAEEADGRDSEKRMAQRFHELLKEDRARELFFLQNRGLANPQASIMFDFAWQNGTINLVKTLDFDLKAPELILEKSTRWFGLLTQLESEIELRSAKVDLILARPQSTDPAILDAFDSAYELLASLKVVDKLKLDHQLQHYAKYALDSVQEPPAEMIQLPTVDPG